MKRTYDFSKGKRGPVLPVPPGKQRITIRLNKDILEYFYDEVDRAGGGNYQTLTTSEASPQTDEPCPLSRLATLATLSQGERVVAVGDRVRGLLLATLPKKLTQKVKFQTSSLLPDADQ